MSRSRSRVSLRRLGAGVRDSVRNGFWAIPTADVIIAVLLAVALVRVDRGLSGERAFTFGAGPKGAREVLGAITTAMITFTGLVFSITVVVLQLTSSQFSPRSCALSCVTGSRSLRWASSSRPSSTRCSCCGP